MFREDLCCETELYALGIPASWEEPHRQFQVCVFIGLMGAICCHPQLFCGDAAAEDWNTLHTTEFPGTCAHGVLRFSTKQEQSGRAYCECWMAPVHAALLYWCGKACGSLALQHCCVLPLPHLCMAHGKLLSISADSIPWKICFVFLDSVPFNAGSLSSRVGREPGASGVSATWLRVVNSEVVRILSWD